MHIGRLFSTATLVVVFACCSLPAHAADIDTYTKACDRLIAQDARAGSAGAAISGDPNLRQGTVSVSDGGRTVTLGEGPGWLFGVSLPLGGGKTLSRVALVRQDGSTTFRAVEALPAGLTAVETAARTTAATVAVDSREAAVTALTDRLLGHSLQGRRVYIANEEVKDTATVALWRGEITLAGGPGWLFFVDDKPQANWEHPCRYVLVAKTGEITTASATMPPKDLAAFTELTSWPTASGKATLLAAQAVTARTAAKAATDASHRYAVIISGGANQSNNHTRYWKDCSYFFTTLKANGFLQDHIYVLISDGQNPAEDQSNNTSSVWDLNADGIDDIRYSALKENITAVFNELAGKMTSEDILYIFTTDHGGNGATNPAPYDNTDVVLWLWNNTSITNAEFAAEVNKVTAKAIVGIFEQCYSGGFAEALKGKNRVLMSASRWWELSYSSYTGNGYDEFSYYVTEALADLTKGDSNDDKIVTMEEAYLYALGKDAFQDETLDGNGDNNSEHPSYYSDPWDLGRKLALTGYHTEAKAPTYGGYAQYQTPDAFPSGGTAKGWQGADQSWPLALPFAFPFGGATYTTVNVGSNGMLSFGTAVTSGLNSVNDLKAAVAVAPYWDKLTTSTMVGDDISVKQDATSVTIIWKAHTWVDNRPVNTAVRLSSNGAIRFYYGTGNQNTSRTEYRDKTIGLSLGDAANGKYILGLRNGAADLGGARALAIQPASMAPPSTALPWSPLLLR